MTVKAIIIVDLPDLQLSNVLHAIDNVDKVNRKSMENFKTNLDTISKRITKVEEFSNFKAPKIDYRIIEYLNVSLEDLKSKNRKLFQSLDKTNFSLLQLGGQLNVGRTSEVSNHFISSY